MVVGFLRSGKIISFHMFTDESWHGHEGWFRLGQVMKDGMFAKMKFTRLGLATTSHAHCQCLVEF